MQHTKTPKYITMPNPLGYFSLSHENPLIADIAESFGDDLSQLGENDRLWLIGRIAHELWLRSNSNEPISAAAEEVIDRLHQLKKWQKLALLKALIN